jgi:predicted transcriptional regulator
MTEESDHRPTEIVGLTADVVAAYLSNNPVPAAALPDLIRSVHISLSGLTKQSTEAPPLVPAVNPKRSVFPDHIISLEDGRKFKSMKRHLGLLGMTPDQYRAKWGLPHDYPMVAPNYSNRRSALAKSFGLGRKSAPSKRPAER